MACVVAATLLSVCAPERADAAPVSPQPRLAREAVAFQAVVSQKVELPAALKAVSFAHAAIGTPYVWGGESRRGYDCSGLTQAAWGHAGVRIPRVADEQFYALRKHKVRVKNLRPGDLLYFHGLGHTGIYIGGGKFIHAPHTGTRVRVQALHGWYTAQLDGAVRPAPWPDPPVVMSRTLPLPPPMPAILFQPPIVHRR